jgi:hypothetical protein
VALAVTKKNARKGTSPGGVAFRRRRPSGAVHPGQQREVRGPRRASRPTPLPRGGASFRAGRGRVQER